MIFYNNNKKPLKKYMKRTIRNALQVRYEKSHEQRSHRMGPITLSTIQIKLGYMSQSDHNLICIKEDSHVEQ